MCSTLSAAPQEMWTNEEPRTLAMKEGIEAQKVIKNGMSNFHPPLPSFLLILTPSHALEFPR